MKLLPSSFFELAVHKLVKESIPLKLLTPDTAIDLPEPFGGSAAFARLYTYLRK